MFSRGAQLSLATMTKAPTSLLEELKQSINRMERESMPTFVGPSQMNPEPGYPAQLSEKQEVPTPPDGLCLSHACIAAGNAKRWLAEHGEQGFLYSGDRTQEILEEHLAKAFRQRVVDLMLEYAQFDSEHHYYCDRAMAIANGSLPEDKDIPFYAACLNGCIEVIPLGYADYQGTSVIGAGPLRISVGNIQALAPDGTSTGHFVLLQSWLPLQTELRHCTAFPFGVCAAARCVAEGLSVATEGSGSRARTEPSTSEQPKDNASDDMKQEASQSPPSVGEQLEDLAQKLRGRESEGRAKILLQDMSVLQAWQQSHEKLGASNAKRDAMFKVGTRWSVHGKLAGKNGQPRMWRRI